MNKNPFPIFAILTMVGTGIAMLQMSVKDTSLIIRMMLPGTVIFLSLLLSSTKWAWGGNKLSRESHYYPFIQTPQPTPSSKLT